MEVHDPTTPEEWQEAVNAAYACLSFSSSRDEWRLIEGGPKINLDRCKDLLARGEALGYEPDKEKVTDFTLAMQMEHPDLRLSHRYERISFGRHVTGRRMR